MIRRPQGIKELREAREQADAERRRMLDHFKEQQRAEKDKRDARAASLETKRNRFKDLKIDEALAAARRLRFIDLEAEGALEASPLNRPSLDLLELFLKVLRARKSVSILQWPRGTRDLSILHPLAMLATICSSPDRTTNGFRWCPAVTDFRTLYYPWRGSGTGTTQRRILVERSELLRRNALHLTRRQVGEAELSTQLDALHVTLGHLTHLKVRDVAKPHLAHPTLGEIYPTFGALGGDNAPTPFRSPIYELFGRVRHGAVLDQLADHRAALGQVATAPFALLGICPRSNVKSTLNLPALTKSRPPDVCVLDLGPPGLARLGPAWERAIEEFLEALIAHHPETPVVAVTHDIYVHRRCASLLIKTGLAELGEGGRSPSSRVVVRSSENCFALDPAIGEVMDVAFRFYSAGGQGAAALRALSKAARECSDPVAAGVLRHTMGNVRRTMSLPCGLRRAYDALVETEGQTVAEAFLERRSAGTVLAAIEKQIQLSSDGVERQRMLSAKQALDAAFDEFEVDTPIGSLLAEVASVVSRKSSPTVIAFATDDERLLGERRICSDDEQGEHIRKRVETEFVRLSTLQALDAELSRIESGEGRNSWKRLVVVAPPADQFAILLGRKWLPEEIIVISDREFVDRLAGTYGMLASHPDLAGPGRIGGRLGKAAATAKTEAQARDVGPLELELEVRPPVVHDEDVIDLTDDEDDDDERDVVEFSLESGRIMRIRPGSPVIRHDRFADVNPFERATAREVTAGNTILVPDRAFVQEARAVLPVRVLAQTRVQVYHTAVEAAIPGLPGASRASKARYVIKRLQAAGARVVVEGTVLDWLNAAEHKLAAAERLRPHAPQRWREFRTFMEVINVPSTLAEIIWREGIEPLRIDRRRAGARMAQAFVSVLVDPHGGSGALPPDIKAKVTRLRKQAMEHLDGVLTVRWHEKRGDFRT